MRLLLRTVLTVLAVSAAVTVGAADYEVPRNLSAKQLLPAAMLKGHAYKIRDVVPTDGYTHRWKVESDFGPFEADGDGALRKLLREIHAIGELKKVSKTSAFNKGLSGAAKAPVGFVKSLVTDPVDTVTGVPKGAYQLVENVSTSATTTGDPSEDSKTAQILKMSAFKREFAAQLDVDPYSSNKALQKELNSVAWASTVGDWAFSVALLPAGAAGSAISNVRLGNSVKNALKDEPPQRLRLLNDERLTKMGIPEELRKRYLDHPAFTPRHDTIITTNLEALDHVAGRDAFLTLALGAQDETEANLYTGMVQLLRGYHQTVSPLTAITALNRITVAQTKAGKALIALPIDHIPWTQRVDQVTTKLKGNTGPGFNGKVDLWLTGTVSPAARRELEARGFSIMENAHTKVEVLD
jgi:hypothetical protein